MTPPDMRRILLNRKELTRVRQAVAYCVGRDLGELATRETLDAITIISADLQLMIDAYTAMYHNSADRASVLVQAGMWEDEMARAVKAWHDRHPQATLPTHSETGGSQ